MKVGATLGPYRVLEKLGEGGMGEVYAATDTRLDRTVAIKVLPAELASDPDRRERFEREAKAIAALNHPHICTLHDVGHEDGTDFLVMEYLEGESLQDRLTKGALPLDQALQIAIQIADALDKAHRQGITHRDLKPGNIFLTKAGAKLLDFGLAKLTDPVRSATASAERSTKLADKLTAEGTILGTFHYMAPEQLEGGEADHRSDIWAFGCVVYEMVTGLKAFDGKSQASLIALIMNGEPPAPSTVETMSPAGLDNAVTTCLVKDPDDRWQSVRDLLRELERVESGGGESTNALTAMMPRLALWQRPVPAAIALMLTAVTVGLAVWSLTRSAPTTPGLITRTSIVIPRTQLRTNTRNRGVAISPKGTHVVYVANDELYMRALDELAAYPLAGTDGSEPAMPFFSPDGEWVAFYSARDRALKKVALAGGVAVTLTEADGLDGASWGADDTIVFGQRGRGIFSVAGRGGTPEELVSVEPRAVALLPRMLPGGDAVLFTLGLPGQFDSAQVVVEQLATGERTVLVDGGSDARYLPTGHLVYARGDTLLAVPFDVERLAVTGGPVPLVEGVAWAAVSGESNADIAQTGALIYLPGDGQGGQARRPVRLVWVDRDGTEDALAAPPRSYSYPRLSPDGTSVALDIRDDDQDIWVWDLSRETLTRLTSDPAVDHQPTWSPDGRRVVFSSMRDGAANLYWRSADGTGAVERLTDSANHQDPGSFSPDGMHLVFDAGTMGRAASSLSSSTTNQDVHVLTLDDERRVAPLLETEFTERNAALSPDGRWMAYQSNASGQFQVYVQPFPDVDSGRWPVSTTGGTRPLWGPEGRELFYMTHAGVMGVTVEAGVDFEVGTPVLVVSGSYVGTSDGDNAGRTYDIAPDGQRFLMLKAGAVGDADDLVAGPTQIIVVQHWFEELKARVPTN